VFGQSVRKLLLQLWQNRCLIFPKFRDAKSFVALFATQAVCGVDHFSEMLHKRGVGSILTNNIGGQMLSTIKFMICKKPKSHTIVFDVFIQTVRLLLRHKFRISPVNLSLVFMWQTFDSELCNTSPTSFLYLLNHTFVAVVFKQCRCHYSRSQIGVTDAGSIVHVFHSCGLFFNSKKLRIFVV
jgi:hypothetical protein